MTKRAAQQPASRAPTREHMLYVPPPKAIDEMSREEFDAWTRENGSLFMMRLPWFKRLLVVVGPRRAAGLLKSCRTYDEASDLWDRVRCDQPLPDAGGPPIGAKWGTP